MKHGAVVLSGGYAHPFDETSASLAEALARAGLGSRVETSVEAVLAALPGARLLAVNALRWSMTQDPKYAPHRALHAGELDDAQLAAMAAHVAGGGALLALHTATICWDTQPGWRALIGGGWRWGRSHHPPLGPVAVALTPEGRDLAAGPATFELIDEAYHALDPDPDCTVRAVATAGGEPQPVAWTRRHGRGRVAVDALGHDRRSLDAPGHAALLAGLIGWVLGQAPYADA